MRNFTKIVKMGAAGIAALAVYPLLHEAGHCAAALLLGADVLEFHILPRAYIVCQADGSGAAANVIIGAAGTLLPSLICLLPCPDGFTMWYTRLMLRVVCVQSILISLAGIFLFFRGTPIENEDITTILRISPLGGAVCAVFYIVALAALTGATAREKPLTKLYGYFYP